MAEYKAEMPERIGNLIKEIQQAVSKERNRYWAAYDLTASQTDVLLMILRHPGGEINQVDLQRRLHLSNPTVAGIVKRLVARGFLEKRPSRKDARFSALCPTEKAIRAHQQGSDNPQLIDAHFLDGLSEDDCARLEASLAQVLQNMRRIQAMQLTAQMLTPPQA